jgi:site-specific DNA-methyltransferase (cytosine-N4-specific)
VEGQLGLEASPAEYVENLRALFAQVRRVLADDGTLWLNLGDSYSGSGKGGQSAEKRSEHWQPDYANKGALYGLPAKNLLGIPWRVAFALQDDGWILRNDIIWAKPNGMPESVTDRMSTKHEHLFLFSKSPRYWFDLDPIREAHGVFKSPGAGNPAAAVGPQDRGGSSQWDRTRTQRDATAYHIGGRNPGDVWSIATRPFSAAHFAVMPSALAERAIQAGCKPGGTVLDPFSGSGTTGLAAARHGHKYVGIDLNAEYLDLSLQTRLAQPGLDFGGVA